MNFENPFEETENSNNKYNNNIIPDDDTFVASFNPNKNINDKNNLNKTKQKILVIHQQNLKEN